MTLAYTFWHQPRPDASISQYEQGLDLFHRRLAGNPVAGFVTSRSLRVPDLPWLAGGGYEDWYIVDDFAALGVLNEAAVDASRRDSHDAMARAVVDGAGGLYRLVGGRYGASTGWSGWFTKEPGVGYPQLLAGLREQIAAGGAAALWQRQLVLGPAPEFRIEGPQPTLVDGARLIADVPLTRVS